jgi:hypothetical protein
LQRQVEFTRCEDRIVDRTRSRLVGNKRGHSRIVRLRMQSQDTGPESFLGSRRCSSQIFEVRFGLRD